MICICEVAECNDSSLGQRPMEGPGHGICLIWGEKSVDGKGSKETNLQIGPWISI